MPSVTQQTRKRPWSGAADSSGLAKAAECMLELSYSLLHPVRPQIEANLR